MFSIKLTARPDARMVEVPLDIEVELPREFDGAAVLVSSGMPRKVRLRTPKDSIKLSTAYRIDQLVGDLVRSVLRGAQQDVARVQEAAALFLRTARERRQEGLGFLVESDGRGRIDVVDQAPPPSPAAFRSSSGSSAGIASGAGTLADRVGSLERSLALLESKLGALPHAEPAERVVRALGDRLEPRLAALEEKLAGLHVEPAGRTPERTAAHLPTPGAARAGLRRATAVEAFADGLRTELKARALAMQRQAEERAALCDAAARIAADAERAGGAPLAAGSALQRLAAESAARTSALARIADEIDLYQAPDVPLAGQLLERLAQAEPPDLLPHLRAIVEEGARSRTLQLGWLSRAAQLAGWKVIAPAPGDLIEPSLHELEGPRGGVVDALLMPGVHDKSGAMLLHARVRARLLDDELQDLVPEPDGSQPLIESAPPALPFETPQELPSLEPLPQEGVGAGDDEVVSAQILEEIVSAPVLSGQPISGPISGPIISAPIISAPIDAAMPFPPLPPLDASPAEEIISAPIVEEIISAPIVEEIISAPIIEELPAAPPGDEPPAAPVLGEAAAPPMAAERAGAALAGGSSIAAAVEAASRPLEELPAPDDDWERVAQGPSAFASDEGRRRAEAGHAAGAPPEPGSHR